MSTTSSVFENFMMNVDSHPKTPTATSAFSDAFLEPMRFLRDGTVMPMPLPLTDNSPLSDASTSSDSSGRLSPSSDHSHSHSPVSVLPPAVPSAPASFLPPVHQFPQFNPLGAPVASSSSSSSSAAPVSAVPLVSMPILTSAGMPPAKRRRRASKALSSNSSTSDSSAAGTHTPPPASSPDNQDVPVAISSSDLLHLLEEQDLKKKRLARKAELARMSRKRKKTRLADLEVEVDQLHDELERLRKQHKQDQEHLERQAQQLAMAQAASANAEARAQASIEQAMQQAHAQSQALAQAQAQVQAQVLAQVEAGVKKEKENPNQPEAREAELAQFVDKVVTVIQSREQAAQAPSNGALDDVLEPRIPLKFLQWAMSHPDKFFADPSGLWHSLFHVDLSCNPNQMADLLTLRDPIKRQVALWSELENEHKKYAGLMKEFITLAAGNLDKLRAVLTPAQYAQYLAWVERFGPICIKITV